MNILKKSLFFIFTACLFVPFTVSSSQGVENFFVESVFDKNERIRVESQFQVESKYIDFYVDKNWWENLSVNEKSVKRKIIDDLGKEFENYIYPQITESFGNIPRHDVVGEEGRLVILFHPMTKDAGGYFRSGDQYSRYQYSRSNEKNILYLNADHIKNPNIPGYLAHEYVHLVTFNEKNKEHGVNEEVWLNELRAEMAITLLGYDDDYQGSNLESRVRGFLRDPDISLTEWTEQAADYGVVAVFGQYLLDHYGEDILRDSLQTKIVGIPSISSALDVSGIEKTFSEVFTDWTLAVYLNDCSYGDYYCYKNENLSNLRVSPAIASIPASDTKRGVVEYRTKNWTGNWHRITGETGTLYVDFYSDHRFNVPYVLCARDGDCEINYLDLDSKGEGKITVEDFNSLYNSLTLIPSLQQKFEGFNGPEKTHSFRWEAQIIGEDKEEYDFDDLRERLTVLQEQAKIILALLQEKQSSNIEKIETNLYYGMSNSESVENLQRFLKKQGEEIYPEGIVSGNFYDLTKEAVIRFQEKHKEDILKPLGLSQGTGYVGEKTRKFINSLLAKSDA